LQAILTLTSVAMLSGARSLYAIAQFGRDYGPQFAKGKTPCCTALHYLFKRLNPAEFERPQGFVTRLQPFTVTLPNPI